MPRNPQIAARARLESAVANRTRALKSLVLLEAKVRHAQIEAVVAGITRSEVAAISGIDRTQVSRIPGMPKGSSRYRTMRHNGAPAKKAPRS